MKYVIGKKEGMTQIFDETGAVHAATVLRVEPAKVTQVKDVEKDGYKAVQIATGAQKEHRVTKAERGHLGGAYKFVGEFRPKPGKEKAIEGVEKGTEFDASVFTPGDAVLVTAVSKGKGFQGVVKRHGFHGDKASHGRKHSHRRPGSIGGGGRAGGRVIKGMRMAGRMGGDLVTVKNLTVLEVNADSNLLLIKGAIPGRKGTTVEVRGV